MELIAKTYAHLTHRSITLFIDNKTFKQIKDVPTSYLAITDEEIGCSIRIP